MFDNPAFDGHEAVLAVADRATGLRAFIAIHDTTLGPALGGCRVWAYDSDGAALTDALRLSQAMTCKAAVAGLPLGGGKSVVLLRQGETKSSEAFAALGAAIDDLGGRYVAAEDVGSSPQDMAAIATRTAHVTGLAKDRGGTGDPSPTTSAGVVAGIEATAEALGLSLGNAHVALQGLGNVGWGVAQRLFERGTRLTVSDLDAARVDAARQAFGAGAVAPDAILSVRADIFSPNALGGILNPGTIGNLAVKAVAGGANNQLASDADGDALAARGILYAPDYVLNAGGVIKMCGEYLGWEEAEVATRVAAIGPRVAAILARSHSEGRATNRIADSLARERLAAEGRAARAPLQTSGLA